MSLLLLMACAGFSFTVAQDGSTVVASGGLLGVLLSEVDLGEFDNFEVSVEQKLADQGVKPGDLNSLELTEVRLSTPDGDLSFLDTLQISVGAKGIDPVEVAHGSDFSGTEKELSLDKADLVPMVVAGGMKFTVDASGSPPAEDTTLRVHVEALGYASPQGAASQVK